MTGRTPLALCKFLQCTLKPCISFQTLLNLSVCCEIISAPLSFCVLVLTCSVLLCTADICCIWRYFALRAAAMNVVEDCDSYDSDGSDNSFLELMEPIEVSKSR